MPFLIEERKVIFGRCRIDIDCKKYCLNYKVINGKWNNECHFCKMFWIVGSLERNTLPLLFKWNSKNKLEDIFDNVIRGRRE